VSMSAEELEIEVMAHRYIYYVMNDQVINDYKYDSMERHARSKLPLSSPVHEVGSSLLSSYQPEHIERANFLIASRE
jgi:NAD-dependent DNA ligase